MNILFLSRWFPYPASNGSKLRIYNILKGLADHHDITLISFADQDNIDADAPHICKICKAVHVVPWSSFNPESFQAKLAFLHPKPRFVIDTFSEEMKALISQHISTGAYDLVIASQFDTAMYSPYFGQVPALFEEAEVGVLYERFAQAETLKRQVRASLTWGKHRRYLQLLLQNFKACTVVSENEKQILTNTVNPQSSKIEVIQNGVDLNHYQNIEKNKQPGTLIFTGAFSYGPNYEAMVWFLEEVFPIVLEAKPDTTLTITGDNKGLPLPSLRNITLTGFVDDIRSLIAQSQLSLVPLHTGGGTRLKILEAMALRTPVIATSKGAEGLEAKNGEQLIITDMPETFAQAIIRLLDNPDRCNALAEKGFQLIQEKYNWDVITPRLLKLIANIC